MINTKKFRLLYLTPILIGFIMFFALGWFAKKVQSPDLTRVFQYTMLTLVATTLYALMPLGLFYGIIDIKRNKDFIVFLGVLTGLTGATMITIYGYEAVRTPLSATLFFVVMCWLAVKLKVKGNDKFKFIFPILTIITRLLYVPGGIIIKHGIEQTSSLLLAYSISILLPLVFSIPLLRNK